MAKGVTARTAWQIVAKKHADYSKEHPEWMGQANEALKKWGDQEMTLQQAVATALQAAYEAGTRGEYPEPINYFDRYKEPERETETHSNGSSRIVRRTRTPAPEGVGDIEPDGGDDPSPRIPRRTRSVPPAETGGGIHVPRVVRSRPTGKPQGATRMMRSRS